MDKNTISLILTNIPSGGVISIRNFLYDNSVKGNKEMAIDMAIGDYTSWLLNFDKMDGKSHNNFVREFIDLPLLTKQLDDITRVTLKDSKLHDLTPR